MGHTRRLAQGSSPYDDHFHDDNDNDDIDIDDYDKDENGSDGEDDLINDENLKKAGRHCPLLA